MAVAHGEAAFCATVFPQGEIQCLGEISIDTSIQTKELILPMTVPEVSSSGK